MDAHGDNVDDMANRTVYLTVKLVIDNPNLDEITDSDVEQVINEVDYNFNNVEDFTIESEIIESEYA